MSRFNHTTKHPKCPLCPTVLRDYDCLFLHLLGKHFLFPEEARELLAGETK